jgi:hypothetical protein
VIGTLGFIALSFTIYLKKKQDYVWDLQRDYIKSRRIVALAKEFDEKHDACVVSN